MTTDRNVKMRTNLFVTPSGFSLRQGVFTSQLPSSNRCHPTLPLTVRTARKARYIRPIVSALPAVITAIPNSVSSLVNPKVLQTSVRAISKLLATLFLGVVAASRGLLDGPTLTALSKVVYNIFLPSLLFSNILTTLSRPLAPGIFFLPLAAVFQVAVGLVLGILGAVLLRLKNAEKRAYIVCAAFGNSAALPLLFASSLFASTPSLPQLVSCISFFLLGWTCLFWSVAYSLLASMNPDKAKEGGSSLNFAMLVKQLVKPPLIAPVVGLSIGLVAPLRTFVMASPFFPAITTLGLGYGPAAVLILAGSLARAGKSKSPTKQENVFRMPRMIAGISITRFICMPAVAWAMVRYGPFRSPFVALALLLEAVMPSAQNSTLILTLEKQPDDATAVAKVLFAVYLVGVIPISIALTFFLAYTGTGL